MASVSRTFDMKKERAPIAGLVIAVVLAIAGIAAWIYQLSTGMRVTALGQQIVWGLYIAAFFTAVGAGAALLAFTGLSEFRPIFPATSRTRLLALSLATCVTGALLITLDVGNPLRLWRVLTAFRLSSGMTWDFWLLTVTGLLALAYLLAARSGGSNKALGAVAIVAAIAVVAVEGWMLSTLAARPLWGSGLTLLAFLLGAAIAGLGLAMIFLTDVAPHVRTALAFTIGLSLALVLAEVLTGLLSSEPRTLAETRLLLSGALAPVFWFHLIAGLLLPLALLRMGLLPLAGVLAVLGVLSEKVWVLVAGQAQPWLALPQGSYFPSWIEFVAVAGILAIGWLVYQGILRFQKAA